MLLAFLFGAALGSWSELFSRIFPGDNGKVLSALNGPSDSASTGVRRSRIAGTQQTVVDGNKPVQAVGNDTALIRVSADLTFHPHYIGNDFLGYEVTASSDDSRFAVGDVVIGVNGDKLADSPMDDEYFMASIADKAAVLDIDRRNPPTP